MTLFLDDRDYPDAIRQALKNYVDGDSYRFVPSYPFTPCLGSKASFTRVAQGPKDVLDGDVPNLHLVLSMSDNFEPMEA
jgi:hypothetical protein